MSEMAGHGNIRCPKCGGEMVKRERKKDGHPFYGCSNYPDCRQTMSVRRHEEEGWSAVGEHPSSGLEPYGDVFFGDKDWY